MRTSFASFSASFLLAACSSSSAGGDTIDAGADVPLDTTSDGISDAPRDAPTDAGVCWDEAGNWIFDFKACTADADCTTGEHSTDCCGTTEIIGIAKSKLSAFPPCETSWSAHWSPCGCPPGPMTAEDGKTVTDPSAALVHCTNFTSSGGVCMTTAP